ncbi:16S rRNA (adenine(1518)-N(6)/adenine(1519)-N(6))-dimethyltransferase RsmA [Chamaesiphon sp. VAR_48_metabat_403]|uniref:16S rRNA (adenine(1518)-N(6)/adenine(1519)-N(6))- dimethyltransferase RsmA n=1 Tax=Chamaesiphon sp. VAR_48_metabat_403 TaxID=2964700 RepID=UPI00286E070B|nr:16S rRNA (adenine(1518)-N(6)/adenine(1519)-N(6))-dimethyltransferase RsmA [Chamaesiphon sp. VAR_48_metabat_403]
MKTKKQFGQHWLRNERVLDRIITAAKIDPTDRILEIGPGTGILTRRLVTVASAVVAVEIDRDLSALLVKKMGHLDNFLLLENDFLNLDVDSNLTAFPNFQQANKVVANIPYNITGPILEKLLGNIVHPAERPFDSIVLLVQKEVGERLFAKPSTKAFGALSIRVQYLADCELICPVPARDFSPPPKVDSAVIRLTPRQLNLKANNPKMLDNLVRLGFSTRRKMLRNNLQSAIDREALVELLVSLGIGAEIRAEDLSVEQWIQLSNLVAERNILIPIQSELH